MTAYPNIPSGGGTVEMAPESALGTAGTYVDQRFSDTNPTFPTNTREGKDVPVGGRQHFASRDAQIVFEKYQESAITVPKYIARPTANGSGLPSIMTLLQSMGCDVVTTTGTDLSAYTDTGAWTLSAQASTDIGAAGLLSIGAATHEYYLPVLVSNYSALAVTPSMDIPAASRSAAEWQNMYCAVPRVRQVPSTATLAFRVRDYYTHTANESQWVYTGCAGAEIGDVTFEPKAPVEMSFTCHVADIAGPADATIEAETFQDSSKFAIVSGDGELHFNFADFADPVTANTRTELLKAVWTPGITVVPIMGVGSSSCLNGIQGYLATYTGAKIQLEMLMDKTRWSDYEGSNTDKYIALTQPCTAVTGTAFGLWLPRCRIYGSPTTNPYEDENFMRVQVTYEPTSPEYGSDTTTDSRGMAPWYFAISGYSG